MKWDHLKEQAGSPHMYKEQAAGNERDREKRQNDKENGWKSRWASCFICEKKRGIYRSFPDRISLSSGSTVYGSGDLPRISSCDCLNPDHINRNGGQPAVVKWLQQAEIIILYTIVYCSLHWTVTIHRQPSIRHLWNRQYRQLQVRILHGRWLYSITPFIP